MCSSIHAHICELLWSILATLQKTLAQRLVGVFLYGSYVTGDFDEQVSDLDLLAVTTTDLNEHELEALKQMHDDLVVRYPTWDDRIEVSSVCIY